MSVNPSEVEGSRTVCGAQGTILRTAERAGFAEVVPCALKTGRDPSTSVGMTEGARLLRTLHHDLMNDEPGEENRQPAQRKAGTQTRRSPIFVRELPNSDTPSSEQGGATTTDQINGLFRLG